MGSSPIACIYARKDKIMFNKKRQKEIEHYHDFYISQYKEFINKLNETPHAVIKNMCIMQLRNIKHIWVNNYHFNVSELEQFDPIGIKI